jgi:hypothetical protein
MGTITTSTECVALVNGAITAAIRQEHEAASTAARSALGHALEAGRLLEEAKAAVPHGSWEAYVRDGCNIAPRTASLYLRLHRNRDRIADRQRGADLSVRQAARLLERPKAKAETVLTVAEPEQAGELRLRVPEWYRPGHRHYGEHPSGWFFEVWPHPVGDEWAHFYVCSPMSGYPGDESATLTGPKRGISVRAIEWAINRQAVNGMPSLDDDGWTITDRPCSLDDASDQIADRFKHYNRMLFAGDDDYRRRGMGLKPKRKQGASA